MAERIIEKATKENVSVLPLGIVAFESREQMAELFKKSLIDYSIEKLRDIEENKIVVEDINFIITKFIIKISLILVFTCFFTSVSCFILKDFVGMYAFLYTVSEELLIVTRSCAFLGLILTVIAFYIENN